MYIIRLDLQKITKSHKEVFEELRQNGIGVNLHYIPVYHHPFYSSKGFAKSYCLEAENYYEEAISIPIYYSLDFSSQEKVINTISKVLSS